MKRIAYILATVLFVNLNGCLPDNFFADLAGSSISAVSGVLLSEALNAIQLPF